MNDSFLISKVSKKWILASIVLALAYFIAVAFFFPVGNKYLFAVLTVTHVYYLWIGLTFWYTIWDTDVELPATHPDFLPAVDVFLTVAGEPREVIGETLKAITGMDYPNFNVYILNDGYVAKAPNWREAEQLAKAFGVSCITRRKPGGAKAGNINNGLKKSDSPVVVIFDADHAPHRDFLRKTAGYFEDPKVGFVQTPQYYKNAKENFITSSAWDQQSLFYGAISKGRNRFNATTMSGTNMAIRRSALVSVGGMDEKNISEDFLTGLRIHAKGYKSIFVPEVLAEGLAPQDFKSYYKQQLRWARGNLEVFFKHNPLLVRGLSWRQRMQYLMSSGYYFSGFIILVNALLPIFFFFTGQVPLAVSTMSLATIFLVYIFVSIYSLAKATNYSYTSKALAFSLGSFAIFNRALLLVVFNVKQGFAITSKKALQGNFLNLTVPHAIYIGVAAIGAIVALAKFGITPSVITNIAWALFYSFIFSISINAALSGREKEESKEEVSTNVKIRAT